MTTLKCKEPAEEEVTLLRKPMRKSARCYELRFGVRLNDNFRLATLQRVLENDDNVDRIAQFVERKDVYVIVTAFVRSREQSKAITIALGILGRTDRVIAGSQPSSARGYKNARTLAQRSGTGRTAHTGNVPIPALRR